jgi:hypothetical protein
MNNNKAQSTIEFTFAMVIVALLIFGLIGVFRWAGMDYAEKSSIRQNSTIFRPWTSVIEDQQGRSQRLKAYTSNF